MAKRTIHSGAEIAAKLAQAGELQRQGKGQSEIARSLGISIMTLHRWRKTSPKAMSASDPSPGSDGDYNQGPSGRMVDLQLENSRLRRLVTDLLLEKINLQEALARHQSSASNKRQV